MKPYPLQFKAEMKERVWGGRALEQFGLEVPEGHIGEAWMISDHPGGITKVINGELTGKGLEEIREQFGADFFGTKGSAAPNGRFPLLIKILDCQDALSIQAHPSDGYAGMPAGEQGKAEMWYILDAKPGAKIVYGLKDGVTRDELEAAIEKGQIMDHLQEVPVAPGDSFYIPSGTVHALGAGILVAEIQQNSDMVYRLYDYDRPGLDGKPRELHIQDSLNVIQYGKFGATRMTTEIAQDNVWFTLTASPFFTAEKGRVESRWELDAVPGSFTILMVCEGTGHLEWEDGSISTKSGDCFLLPANLGSYTIKGQVTILRSYLG